VLESSRRMLILHLNKSGTRSLFSSLPLAQQILIIRSPEKRFGDLYLSRRSAGDSGSCRTGAPYGLDATSGPT